MSSSCTQTDPERPATVALRAATGDQHQRLHDHPLMVELFTRPTLDAYQDVLQGFLSFYRPVEPALVECCRRLGVAERYPQSVRTRWLVADLSSLGCQSERLLSRLPHQNPLPLNSLGELAGCLYVIEGSALGGPAILRSISGKLSVESACRFFRSDGVETPRNWTAFQAFCEQACDCAAARRAAIEAARHTFESIAECLTRVEVQVSRAEG